jgi:uncharacterized protein (TIGR03435 family)
MLSAVRTMTLLAVAMLTIAQTKASQGPLKFEVASVKANHSGGNAVGNHFTEQQTSWTNVPLTVLIRSVYRLKNYQLIGAPAWADNEKWDIDAKSEGKTTGKQRNEMLGNLLADRFHLQFHRETRELPVYRLVIAKGGVKMTQIKDGEVRPQKPGISNRPSHLMGWASPVGQLVYFLSGDYLNEPIIDATGLTGNYDFDLKWTPDPNQAYQRDEAADPNGPSLFVAIQEQLGLRLEATKGPVEVLIIDHVEHPTEN